MSDVKFPREKTIEKYFRNSAEIISKEEFLILIRLARWCDDRGYCDTSKLVSDLFDSKGKADEALSDLQTLGLVIWHNRCQPDGEFTWGDVSWNITDLGIKDFCRDPSCREGWYNVRD